MLFVFIMILGCNHESLLSVFHEFPTYRNRDGSQNMYCVDTCLKLDMEHYVIVKSSRNLHAFLLPECVWRRDKLTEKDILEHSYFILGYKMSSLWCDCLYLRTVVSPREYEILGDTGDSSPQLIPDLNSDEKDTYSIYHYEEPPSFFYLLMIRADTYNFITGCHVDIAASSKLKFKNLKGYVKMIVPVWNNKYWLHTSSY